MTAQSLLSVHADITPDQLARPSSGGTGTVSSSHPLGNKKQFHGFAPNSKVSGFPWRERAVVRPGLGWQDPEDGFIRVCLQFSLYVPATLQ
jgi:hypothetical protein